MAGSSRKIGSVEGNEPKMEPIGLCHVCTHRTELFPPECTAFPGGIPAEILVGQVLHTSPYPGDHGIQFNHAGGLQV